MKNLMNTFWELIDKISNRKWVFPFVFIFLFLAYIFQNVLTSNEVITLTYAKHFMNKNWIPDDLFMNQNPGYMFLFSVIAGSLARFLPLTVVSVVIRILATVGFSYLLMKIAETFHENSFVMVIFLFFFLRFQSIVAGEWILALSEGKTFSYIFALFSLVYFIRSDYAPTFIFLGLSLSFHVLVGAYASISMLLMFLINISRLRREYIQILKKIYFFFIFSSFGIFAAVQNIFKQVNMDRIQLARIAVTIREAHHQIPSEWTGDRWIIKLIMCVVGLVIIFIFVKDNKYRMLSSFGLSTLVFFLVGFLVFWSGKLHLLKYFWFRFPDTILPFVGFLATISIAIKIITTMNFVTLRQVMSRSITLAILVFVMLAFVSGAMKFRKSIRQIIADPMYFYLQSNEEAIKDTMLWIRANTDKASKFLVSPFIDDFYVGAERGAFVLFKAGPLTESAYEEWYKRLRICNGNNDFTKYGWKNQQEVEEKFYSFSETDLRRIASEYDMQYYVGLKGRQLPFQVEYSNSKYAVYSLR